MDKLYAYVCPHCGRQYRGPGGHSVGGDDRASSCFHRDDEGREAIQPRLIRIEVEPVPPFIPRALPPLPAAMTEEDS